LYPYNIGSFKYILLYALSTFFSNILLFI
jgi:hypothetical protein